MIGVCEQIGRELVIIPNKTMLEIVTNRFRTDTCKVFAHHETVESPYAYIHACSLYNCTPRTTGQSQRILKYKSGILRNISLPLKILAK